MTDRELMKWALYALEGSNAYDWPVVEELKERLAQTEQEPVAWITDGGKGELWWHQSSKFDEEGNLIGPNPDDIPLYTAPPKREWVGLTDEDMEALFLNEDGVRFARYIEAKLREKNHG